jgi:hypothetical protein
VRHRAGSVALFVDEAAELPPVKRHHPAWARQGRSRGMMLPAHAAREDQFTIST